MVEEAEALKLRLEQEAAAKLEAELAKKNEQLNNTLAQSLQNFQQYGVDIADKIEAEVDAR